MKILIMMVVFGFAASIQCSASTNVLLPARIQASVTETYASGWVPPTTWKYVYDKQVIQSEVALQINTPEWNLLRATRFIVWTQNTPDEDHAFAPPGGEVDYAVCFFGPELKKVKTSLEFRYVDLGGARGARVGDLGDNDLLRFRLKFDYPMLFDGGRNAFLYSLTYFHVEPISYRPRYSGDVVSFQVLDEFKLRPWAKVTANAGYMYDGGVNGGISANIISYGCGIGLRLMKKNPECWVTAGVQAYNTLDSPLNRPRDNFIVASVSTSFKF